MTPNRPRNIFFVRLPYGYKKEFFDQAAFDELGIVKSILPPLHDPLVSQVKNLSLFTEFAQRSDYDPNYDLIGTYSTPNILFAQLMTCLFDAGIDSVLLASYRKNAKKVTQFRIYLNLDTAEEQEAPLEDLA